MNITDTTSIDILPNIKRQLCHNDNLKNYDTGAKQQKLTQDLYSTISDRDFAKFVHNKKQVTFSYALTKSNKPYILSDGDWYFIGTIVYKSEIKNSSKDKSYSFWKMRNMADDPSGAGIHDLTLFLFGEAFKESWKLTEGSLVAVLNPEYSSMDENSFNGKKASNISKNASFCLFQSGHLLELGQTKNFGICKGVCKNGLPCKTYIIISTGSNYCVNHLQSALKKCLNKRLELNAAYGSARPLTTLKNHRNIPIHKPIITPKFKTNKTLLENNDNSEGRKREFGDSLQKLMSIHHTTSTKSKTAMMNRNFPGPITKASQLLKDGIKQMSNLKTYNQNPALKNNCMFSIIAKNGTQKLMSSSKSLSIDSIQTKSSQVIPRLGKGFEKGNDSFTFDIDIVTDESITEEKFYHTPNFQSKLSKSLSLQAIDPNNIKPVINKSYVDKVSNKLMIENEKNNNTIKKRPLKVLGSIMSQEKMDYILNKKTSHLDIVEAQILEKQESYFGEMQGRENIQTSMEKVMEMKCRIATCTQCQYTYWSASQRCRSSHPQHLKYHEAIKRFYQCKQCKARYTIFTQFPDKACTGCGQYNYERIPMYKSNDEGILQPQEKLLIRGEKESKFLNGIN